MTAQDQTQIVTFRLGDDLFAADIFSVERVLRYEPPSPSRGRTGPTARCQCGLPAP